MHHVNGNDGLGYFHVNTYPDQPLADGDFRSSLSYDLPDYDQDNSGGGFSIYRNDPAVYEYA